MVVRNQIESIGSFLGETSSVNKGFLGNESVDGLSDVWLNGVCDDGDDAVAVWD